MREGKSLFAKKKKKIRLVILFKLKLFSREVSSLWKVFIWDCPWILARTDGGRNHYVMFVPYYLRKFLNLYISQTKEISQCRSSHQRFSIEKAVFKNFAIFTGKRLRWRLFLIQLQAQAWRPATVLKETLTKCFSVNIAKILRIPIFKKTCK